MKCGKILQHITTLTFMQQGPCISSSPPATSNAAGRGCAGSSLPVSTEVTWTLLDLQARHGSLSRNTTVHLLNVTVRLHKSETAA